MTENLSENDLILQRRAKLDELRKKGIAYPNTFRRDSLSGDLRNQYKEASKEELEEKSIQVTVAGRIMLQRIMGKASFITIQDMEGQIQAYIRSNDLPEGQYEDFKTWDLGDIVGVSGKLFLTKTGELTVHAGSIEMLTKSLRPLPEKHSGLVDTEQRYRKRYLDLITNPDSLDIFKKRSQIVSSIRDFFIKNNYLEVETPMMHSVLGGAAAKPFTTHHNALDMDLYLRIAPELYLKRLVVGGLEKVFEINRNFRNEGLSTKHNPEFTMLEYYSAYADFNDQMAFIEDLFKTLTEQVLGSSKIDQNGVSYDFSQPFKKISLKDAVSEKLSVDSSSLDGRDFLLEIGKRYKLENLDNMSDGKILFELFEELVEGDLIQPTFITGYPKDVSPLSRSSDVNSLEVDRFELFIGGKEIANGFSELNDPEDQAERFRMQVDQKTAGDEEAMEYDSDYIEALEYGLPPCAGVGIGIDRLVMLLTGAQSIRDVLLFPQMKPKN
ncbi:MAG: lysine--tRNA ligase [Gammaproteobacteria bacterium]|nr:MAG: lysine--tRNA ligase [Gammaproteobacteria bacterium]|tara:strand:+ start:1665 stop:3152 length:1488 start_codon:yes stop_codon:yes gene_type:complete